SITRIPLRFLETIAEKAGGPQPSAKPCQSHGLSGEGQWVRQFSRSEFPQLAVVFAKSSPEFRHTRSKLPLICVDNRSAQFADAIVEPQEPYVPGHRHFGRPRIQSILQTDSLAPPCPHV